MRVESHKPAMTDLGGGESNRKRWEDKFGWDDSRAFQPIHLQRKPVICITLSLSQNNWTVAIPDRVFLIFPSL